MAPPPAESDVGSVSSSNQEEVEDAREEAEEAREEYEETYEEAYRSDPGSVANRCITSPRQIAFLHAMRSKPQSRTNNLFLMKKPEYSTANISCILKILKTLFMTDSNICNPRIGPVIYNDWIMLKLLNRTILGIRC